MTAILNVEGAKIQAIAAMSDATTQQLLSLNKNVADMSESISTLERILKQKLNIINCQMNDACNEPLKRLLPK